MNHCDTSAVFQPGCNCWLCRFMLSPHLTSHLGVREERSQMLLSSRIRHSILFLLIILANAEISNAFLEPCNSHSKLSGFETAKQIAKTGISVLLSYALSSRKVEAASGKSIEYPDAAAFYQLYQYKEPKDILIYINDCNIKDGDGPRVTEALETFSIYYPMYKLSKEKVQILTNEIKNMRPQNILEIGTFFGYSALNMAMNLSPGASLTCIEANKNNADVARFVLDKGLGPSSKSRESVKIVDGISSAVLKNYESLLGTEPFDFVFLDHDKDCYLKDLKTLEINGMLAPNCLIVADNVVFPGAPGYLEYVADTKGESAGNEASKKSDGVEGRYSTRLVSTPFERVGFETQWKQVDDAMSITTYTK